MVIEKPGRIFMGGRSVNDRLFKIEHRVLDLPVAPDSGAGAGRIAMQGQKPCQAVGSLALKSLSKRFSNTGNGTIPPDRTVS